MVTWFLYVNLHGESRGYLQLFLSVIECGEYRLSPNCKRNFGVFRTSPHSRVGEDRDEKKGSIEFDRQ